MESDGSDRESGSVSHGEGADMWARLVSGREREEREEGNNAWALRCWATERWAISTERAGGLREDGSGPHGRETGQANWLGQKGEMTNYFFF